MDEGPGNSADAKAWGEFWKRNSGGDANGCLPERWAAIEEAQRQAWRDFAAQLPEEAHLLDCATGDGRVLRWLREERSDLDLTGIDRAEELPPAPEGTVLRGGVEMEALPFEDGAFHAVTSQFGFEYGDTAKVAGEIGRVLREGGLVGLMVHRGDGPILEHNLRRREAIRWAVEEKQIVETIMRALTDARGGFGAAAQVGAALAMVGAKLHGETSPAWEIPEAARRTIIMGHKRGAPVEDIEATLRTIAEQAENELGRIASLERACGRADARDQLAEAFAVKGLALTETREVREPTGRAFADFLTFS